MVVALYDYTASSELDVTIKEGEMLMELEGGDGDWMRVRTSNGAIGLVPRTYVSAASASESYRARVLYDYSPDGNDSMYMSITEGMIVTVTDENDGWCNGHTDDGKEGWFPASYVERI